MISEVTDLPARKDSDGIHASAAGAAKGPDGFDRLAAALLGNPFLTGGHFGSYAPTDLGWRSPGRFPMTDEDAGSADSIPSWTVTAKQGMALFSRRIAPAQSQLALPTVFRCSHA
jgi:hypothetical protein